MATRKPATSHEEIIAAVAELSTEVRLLRSNVAALEDRVNDLTGLRNKGLGVGASLLFIAALLGSKMESALKNLFG